MSTQRESKRESFRNKVQRHTAAVLRRIVDGYYKHHVAFRAPELIGINTNSIILDIVLLRASECNAVCFALATSAQSRSGCRNTESNWLIVGKVVCFCFTYTLTYCQHKRAAYLMVPMCERYPHSAAI